MTRTWKAALAASALAMTTGLMAQNEVPAVGAAPKPAAPTSSRPSDQPPIEPAVDTSTASQPPPRASRTVANQRPAPRRAMDRIELEASQITGNRELPKVLVIVPWKRPELGDLVGKPVNSLIDEVLAPVDRDVFRRENRYYDALQPDVKRGTLPPSPQPAVRDGSQSEPPSGN